MKPSSVAVLMGVAALLTSIPSHADGHRKDARDVHRIGSGMQAIVNHSSIGQPGYGWRYYGDARKGRAVVIGPGGDYFYSHGEGLSVVFEGSPDRGGPTRRPGGRRAVLDVS
jgi:hypothetical protein